MRSLKPLPHVTRFLFYSDHSCKGMQCCASYDKGWVREAHEYHLTAHSILSKNKLYETISSEQMMPVFLLLYLCFVVRQTIFSNGHIYPYTLPPSISPCWPRRFLNRNKQFFEKKQKPLAIYRKNAHNVKYFMIYFEKYKEIRIQKGITDANVWNMDERGFRVGCGIAHWVITMDAEKRLLLSDPDNREFLTACETISGGGVDLDATYEAAARAARKKLTGRVAQKGGGIIVREIRGRIAKRAEDEVEKARNALRRAEIAAEKVEVKRPEKDQKSFVKRSQGIFKG